MTHAAIWRKEVRQKEPQVLRSRDRKEEEVIEGQAHLLPAPLQVVTYSRLGWLEHGEWSEEIRN